MAQFMAVIKGQRGAVSRLGSKRSGIEARINGWHSGVTVNARFNETTGRDEFEIYKTSGSNGGESDVLIGTIR